MADNNKKHIIVCGKGGGGSGTQVQADWNETDNTSPAYINNKPTNVSDFTNDAGYITNADVLAYKAFPTGWHTTGTMADLISDINNDSDAVVGMSYMDTVSFSDLPTGMQQGEIQVDVVSEQTGLGKVLNFTLKSSNLSPYHWEYTSAYGAAGTWRGFMPNTTLATVATTGNYSDLNGTPTIPANTSDLNNDSGFITINDVPAQVNADWNESDSTSPAYIENKPTIPAAQVQADWNESDSSDPSYIQNKPTIPAAQVNSDWNANSGVAQILNKPTIPTVPPMTTELLTFTLSDLSTTSILVYVKPEPFYIKDLSGSDNTLSITKNDSGVPTAEFFASTDMITWTSIGSTSGVNVPITATVPANGKLYLKANADKLGGFSFYTFMNCTGNYAIGGYIMSLIKGDNYTSTTLAGTGQYPGSHFRGLFKDSLTLIDASKLILPEDAYNNTYWETFMNCTSLTTAPATLSATTLYSEPCRDMFKGCTSLTTAPALPATTLISSCYTGMFSGCTSLTTAPVLPATTLASSCYSSMFQNCTSLTTAPVLPATTLAQYCYNGMFQGCTSLTTAPALPATTLTTYCYQNMFKGCTSLNSVTTYANNISATNCLKDWLNNVAATGDFYKLGSANYPSGASGIPSGWTTHTSL